MSDTKSLRIRQKERRRREIVSAARILFSRKGYKTSSMDEVAIEADVGVATVFNYFGSKAGLLAAVLREDFDHVFKGTEMIIARPPVGAKSGVLKVLEAYLSIVDTSVGVDTLSYALGPGLTAEPVLDSLTNDIETEAISQLHTLISHYIDHKKIRSAINAKDAAIIIFFLFNQNYVSLVTGQKRNLELVRKDLTRHVTFILDSIAA